MNITSLFQPGWKFCGVALLVGGLLGAWGTWWIVHNKYDAEIAELKQRHSDALKSISDEASAQRDKNAALEHSFSNEVAKSDQKHTQELNNALSENKALRNAVTSGSRKLLLAKAGLATCNLSKSTVTRSPLVGNGTEIEFSPDFGRNIYDIRSGAITDGEKVDQLQEYIRAGQKAGVIAGGQ